MLILIVGLGRLIQIPERAYRETGIVVVKMSVAAEWTALDLHFKKHFKLVNRFRGSGGDAVVRMWRSQTKENGERLSKTQRAALIERHCELFGTWPD